MHTASVSAARGPWCLSPPFEAVFKVDSVQQIVDLLLRPIGRGPVDFIHVEPYTFFQVHHERAPVTPLRQVRAQPIGKFADALLSELGVEVAQLDPSCKTTRQLVERVDSALLAIESRVLIPNLAEV